MPDQTPTTRQYGDGALHALQEAVIRTPYSWQEWIEAWCEFCDEWVADCDCTDDEDGDAAD